MYCNRLQLIVSNQGNHQITKYKTKLTGYHEIWIIT